MYTLAHASIWIGMYGIGTGRQSGGGFFPEKSCWVEKTITNWNVRESDTILDWIKWKLLYENVLGQ